MVPHIGPIRVSQRLVLSPRSQKKKVQSVKEITNIKPITANKLGWFRQCRQVKNII